MWNDLSGVWLDYFRLNFEQQAWLLYLKLLAIREALSTLLGATRQLKIKQCNSSGGLTLAITASREKKLRAEAIGSIHHKHRRSATADSS